MPLDPNRLLIFDAAVRAGSFSAAARALGVSRQAVSEQVAKLEAELEVRLLDRNTRTLNVTDAGRQLSERSREVALLLREAEADIAGLQGRPAGRLRVSVPGAFGRMFMAPLAGRMLRLHPDLTVDTHISDRHVNLIEEGFDAAVRVGELDDSSLVRRKLGTDQLVFVISPALLSEHGEPSVDSLSEFPTVAMHMDETWSLHDRPVRALPRLVLDDLQAVVEAAVEGIGIARVPRFSIKEALRAGQLQHVLEDHPQPTRQLSVVYPSRRWVPAKVRCFVEAMLEHARETFS